MLNFFGSCQLLSVKLLARDMIYGQVVSLLVGLLLFGLFDYKQCNDGAQLKVLNAEIKSRTHTEA